MNHIQSYRKYRRYKRWKFKEVLNKHFKKQSRLMQEKLDEQLIELINGYAIGAPCYFEVDDKRISDFFKNDMT